MDTCKDLILGLDVLTLLLLIGSISFDFALKSLYLGALQTKFLAIEKLQYNLPMALQIMFLRRVSLD